MTDRTNTPERPTLLDRDSLADVVELLLWAGQLLMEHGAESERVEQTLRSCGKSFGCDWGNVLVTYNAIIVTHASGADFRTKIRRARPRAVDMRVIEQVSHLSHRVAEGRLDRQAFRAALHQLEEEPRHYPVALSALSAGLACAAFARIFHGDWVAFVATFLGSASATWLRSRLTRAGLNRLLVVALSAATASSIVAGLQHTVLRSETFHAALAACVLMLVPGVPAINATEDLIKGHTSVGVARACEAGLVVLAATLGLLFATSISVSAP